MISPVKASVESGYGALDDRLAAAVHLRFGLPATLPISIKKKIKKADKISAWLEAVQVAGFTLTEANKFFGAPDDAVAQGLKIVLRPPVEVREAYVARHNTLIALL
jgi:5'-deoxynucleotidase YfbR-like HD superfamily hydrolase